MKFGDDAVAEENYRCVLVAPPPVACGCKWPLNMGKTRPSGFLSDETITIRNVSAQIYFITIKGPTINTNAEFYDSSLGSLRSD